MRLYPTGPLTGHAFPALRLPAWSWQTRVVLLAGLGVFTTLTYWLGLLLPYNLFTLGLGPGRSLATLTEGHPPAQLSLVLTTAALWCFYLLTWRLCRLPAQADGQPTETPWPMWAVVLGTALVAAFWLLWLYPVGSADVFDNIAYGRIALLWHGNPFYQTISQYNDPVATYAGWPFATSAYGPLWVMLTVWATAVGELAGGGMVANLLVFKLVSVGFYIGCVLIVVWVLQRHAPERALAGTCLFALNPLVLFETAGNGHNDIVLVFCLLLLGRPWPRAGIPWRPSP
jgi:hypothetical protein